MTSSLRNSLHRRNHKERSQLAHRTKFGILEKHKDYVKRARDYHSKQDRLTRLRQKAADRNKDEFYFSMTKEKTRRGVHVKDRGNTALPVDIVKVLKTQDENYVRTMRTSNAKKIDSLKTQLTTMADLIKDPLAEDDEEGLDEDELKVLRESGILQTPQNRKRRKTGHILFVDSIEEAQQITSQSPPPKRLLSNEDTQSSVTSPSTEVDLGWKSDERKRKRRKPSRPTVLASENTEDDTSMMDDLDILNDGSQPKTTKQRLLKELSARLRRDLQLRYAQREFEMQRLLMGKGAHKKIAGVEKANGDQESEEEDDQDEIDARKGRRRNTTKKVDEETYKPRVYKWKSERKR